MHGRMAPGWFPPDPEVYAYLFGLYLGDGCVSVARGHAPFIRIVLDEAYPGIIIAEATDALRALLPDGTAVRVYRSPHAAAKIVQASYQHWLDVLPQHGPGRKHDRRIELRPWQRLLLDRAPEAFLRGLIHSDGCRTVNRFTTTLPSGRVAEYAYPRYFFSNRSADIRGLFCDYCDALGIRWTQSNARNVSVAHRTSVARLDAFVGEKR